MSEEPTRDELLRRIDDARLVTEGYFNVTIPGPKCGHGKFYFEDCIACYDEAIIAALDGEPQEATIAARQFQTTSPSPPPVSRD